MAMHQLVLIRHGQSTWNLENRFTGWADVELTPLGVSQAQQAGRLLKASAFDFDVAYTSMLKRSAWTLWHLLDQMDRTWLPVVPTWRLNERHYGALQGLNKVDTAAEFGQAQVMIWRRSYRTPPPALEASDPRCERGDRRYAKLEPQQIPLTECLHDTVERVLPFWYDTIVPAIMGGQRVVVVAHGNSIRALMKHLENISEADIVELNIPNAVPVVYDLDASMRPIGRRFLEAQPT